MRRLYVSLFVFFIQISSTFAAQNPPAINCKGLPGCVDNSIVSPGKGDVAKNVAADYIRSAISILIDIVAVAAVFALIFGGIYYIISGGNEEKTGKAKKIVLWALAGVVLSVLSWGIIELLNNISITV